MENLFYPGYWSTRPVRPRGAPPAMVKPSLPAKVVPIPVHFVGSDETKQRQPEAAVPPFAAASRATERITSSTAALAIQSAFRGFLVRKNLKAVRRIEAEVDAVEKEVAQAGDRLRRNERERLRLNEALMALLFRLDSVRGVREYRRRVIRRTIALQEAVDAIATVEEPKEGLAAAGDDVGEISEGNASLETPEEVQEATPAEITRSVDSDLRTLESHNEEPCNRDEDTDAKKAIEEEDVGELAAKELEEEGSEDSAKVAMEELHALPTKEALCIGDVLGDGSDAEDTGEASEDRIGDLLGDADKCNREMGQGNGEVETGICPQPEEMPSSPRASAQSPTGAAAQGCMDAPMRQAMERMVEESRGLKGLVAELCERNEVQLRLMDGLLQRVERLEKVVDKMGRKKQKTQCAKKQKRPDAKK